MSFSREFLDPAMKTKEIQTKRHHTSPEAPHGLISPLTPTQSVNGAPLSRRPAGFSVFSTEGLPRQSAA